MSPVRDRREPLRTETFLRTLPSLRRARCTAPQPRRGVARFVARLAMHPQVCAPVSRSPFPQIPAFEDRCIPAGFVARPHRTTSGTPRSCASPIGAHRPSLCTASSATDSWRPASPRPPLRPLRQQPGTLGDAGGSTRRPVERMGGDTPLPHPESGMSPVSGTGSERAKIASVAYAEAPREPGATGGLLSSPCNPLPLGGDTPQRTTRSRNVPPWVRDAGEEGPPRRGRGSPPSPPRTAPGEGTRQRAGEDRERSVCGTPPRARGHGWLTLLSLQSTPVRGGHTSTDNRSVPAHGEPLPA